MQVRFRTTRLRTCYEQARHAERAWGADVAAAYRRRIETLKACETLQAVRAFRHLRLHKLKGDRQGRYALTLHGRWRLLVTFEEGPPVRAHIEEVNIHYGD